MILDDLVFLPVEHNVSKCYLAAFLDAGVRPGQTVYLEREGVLPEGTAVSKGERGRGRGIGPMLKRARELGIRVTLKNVAASMAMAFAQMQAVGSTRQRDACLGELRAEVFSYCKDLGLPHVDMSLSVPELLDKYDVPFERQAMTSINDTKVLECLGKQGGQRYALFVGGGILREPILGLGVRFLHIHPGVVPHIKGSSCLLWSALVRGRIGMSCFFMNRGIDTGDVVETKEYALPRIEIRRRCLKGLSAADRSRILIDCLDPFYRADLLRDLLRRSSQVGQWESRPQDPALGRVYYHPSEPLRERMVNKFFETQV